MDNKKNKLNNDAQFIFDNFLALLKNIKNIRALSLSGSLATNQYAKGSDIDLYGYSFELNNAHLNEIIEYILENNTANTYSVQIQPYGYQIIFEYLNTCSYPLMIDLHLFFNKNVLITHPRSREFLININDNSILLFGNEYFNSKIQPIINLGLNDNDYVAIEKEIFNEIKYLSIIIRKNYLKHDFLTASYRLLKLLDNLPRYYNAQNKIRFSGFNSFMDNYKTSEEVMHLLKKLGKFTISNNESSLRRMYNICRMTYLKYTEIEIGILPAIDNKVSNNELSR